MHLLWHVRQIYTPNTMDVNISISATNARANTNINMGKLLSFERERLIRTADYDNYSMEPGSVPKNLKFNEIMACQAIWTCLVGANNVCLVLSAIRAAILIFQNHNWQAPPQESTYRASESFLTARRACSCRSRGPQRQASPVACPVDN
jgi:hypothetical protein